MNLIDIGALLILAICVLGGYYRGFVSTGLNILAGIISFIIALALVPVVSGTVKNQESLYNSLLYYTEGSEYVAKTSVELIRTPIADLPGERIEEVIRNASMPNPMGRAVGKNIARQTFAKEQITTLGDYFNLTIVSVFLNILSMLAVFFVIRIIFAFLIRGIDYGRGGYPVLVQWDGVIGAGLGLIDGILLLFVCFMLVPIVLTVLPKFYELLSSSVFGEFFYQANFLLYFVPIA